MYGRYHSQQYYSHLQLENLFNYLVSIIQTYSLTQLLTSQIEKYYMIKMPQLLCIYSWDFSLSKQRQLLTLINQPIINTVSQNKCYSVLIRHVLNFPDTNENSTS